jgi:cytochrome P450
VYERLRVEEPVAKATLWDGTEAWLVARYDEVRAVLRELPVSADITRPTSCVSSPCRSRPR